MYYLYMNNIYKPSDIKQSTKLVITHFNRSFKADEIESAINAVDYAAKKCLRLDRAVQVTGTGTILGKVMILDLDIPLSYSNSHDYTTHEHEFKKEVLEYLRYGVHHKTRGEWYGDFGTVNAEWFNESPVRVVTVETSLSDSEIVARLGADAKLV